jgi:hypothetical protein
MGGACGTDGRQEIVVTEPEGRRTLQVVGVYRRIILKRVFKK